jgi:hypothetical protein
MNPPYLALHEAGLRNGSFFRFNAKTKQWAHYINGDFMGFVIPKPTTYAGLPLKEFPEAQAVKLIPKICGGKG